MAALTFFIATATSPKRFSREDLETFILKLLHEEHVCLPAVIFVGPARNALCDENIDAVNEDAKLFRPSEYVIPNAPETMLGLAEYIVQGKWKSAETLWYFGDNEPAFKEALRRVPFEEKDCCICFPCLNQYLSNCAWFGAAIYVLTQPFSIDFMDVFDTTARPLLDYPTAHFFTLASFRGGAFSDVANNPLKPLLERYFGPELDMRQT